MIRYARNPGGGCFYRIAVEVEKEKKGIGKEGKFSEERGPAFPSKDFALIEFLFRGGFDRKVWFVKRQ